MHSGHFCPAASQAQGLAGTRDHRQVRHRPLRRGLDPHPRLDALALPARAHAGLATYGSRGGRREPRPDGDVQDRRGEEQWVQPGLGAAALSPVRPGRGHARPRLRPLLCQAGEQGGRRAARGVLHQPGQPQARYVPLALAVVPSRADCDRCV